MIFVVRLNDMKKKLPRKSLIIYTIFICEHFEIFSFEKTNLFWLSKLWVVKLCNTKGMSIFGSALY